MMALQVAKDRLPTYAHMYSPRKFSQPQLFACLVLKRHFKLDYRGIVALHADIPALCEDIGLKSVPHYTTLQKAAHGGDTFSCGLRNETATRPNER